MLAEALMWTVFVEVTLVGAEHSTSMTLVIDQHPVGALGPDAADEPFPRNSSRVACGVES
jgi:hypothetical protein